MDHPDGSLFTAFHSDADVARLLQEANPFFQARAERYDLLDAAIRQFDPQDASQSNRRYKAFLTKRRDILLHEMVQLVEATKHGPAPRPATVIPKSPRKDWIWL